MTGLDKLSILLGKIQANQENLEEKFDNHIPLLHKKIDNINKDLSNHKVKTAYIAGGIAIVTTLLIGYLKSQLF